MEEEKKGTEEEEGKERGPASRGIPSKRALLFEYGGLPMPTTARWEYGDILKLVFPPELQRVQYDVACKLIRFLSERDAADGDDVAAWAKVNGVSNATLRNLVIPKLYRVGMLARERENPSGMKERDKRKKMVLSISKRFGEAFKHIGSEWDFIVEGWRKRRG